MHSRLQAHGLDQVLVLRACETAFGSVFFQFMLCGLRLDGCLRGMGGSAGSHGNQHERVMACSWRSLPFAMGRARTGNYPTGDYPTRGHPAGGYPMRGHTMAVCPTAGYPRGGYPIGGYPTGGHPTGGHPTGGIALVGWKHFHWAQSWESHLVIREM